MSILSIEIKNFRNFLDFSVPIPEKGIRIIGANGLGKTSILEAIHYVLVGKSQRGALKRDIINKNESEFYIEGKFLDKSSVSLGYSKKNKKSIIKKNGIPCKSINEWFANNSVISFGPDDYQLVFGSPSDRRKYVDILLSISDKEYLENLIRYKKEILNRNKLLTNSLDSDLFEIFEQKIGKYGNYVYSRRVKAIEYIKNDFIDINNTILGDKNISNINIKSTINVDNVDNYEEMLITSLKKRREKDRIMGFSTIGPHRDDFLIKFNNSISKSICSRGQGRVLSISIKISSLNWLNSLNKSKPIILIDDAFSELDSKKTEKIYNLIRDRGQILLTSLPNNEVLDSELEEFNLNE